MLRLRRGRVLAVLDERPGAVEVSVDVEGERAGRSEDSPGHLGRQKPVPSARRRHPAYQLINHGPVSRTEVRQRADPVEVLLAGYRTYLVEERGLAASTVRNYLDVARPFVSARWASGRADLSGLTAAEVGEFVLAGCRTRAVGSATIFVVGMRALLRYLHLAGITPTGLAGAVPSAAC